MPENRRMADLIHCTDRFAYIRIKLDRETWAELLDRHLNQAEALRTVRVACHNAISARLVEFAMQELEHRAAASNSGSDLD